MLIGKMFMFELFNLMEKIIIKYIAKFRKKLNRNYVFSQKNLH